jgi:23S rRNA (adenine2030-N6)-methyltransferase
MNYRHAFHAGNFADCLKHAVLVWLLQAMARKEKPFCVLDTHAGAGQYDLTAGTAQRTGEAQTGIMRLLDDTPPALAEYVGLIRRLGLYPGSPAIVRALLRPGDRAIACELHPEEHAALRRMFGRNPAVSVHLRDGYEAIGAFLPPAERRGLTLIDPPYEAAGEFGQVQAALAAAQARFAGGVIAAWFPIKHRAPIRAFYDALRTEGLRDAVAIEFLLREPLDPARLNGCGMILVNPPFRFEAELPPILGALLDRLGDRAAGEAARVERLTDE